jgi:hypothetical protein
MWTIFAQLAHSARVTKDSPWKNKKKDRDQGKNKKMPILPLKIGIFKR